MITTLKQAIKTTLAEIYPTYTIYDEEIPESVEPPVFLIVLKEQKYRKRMNNKFRNVLSFDISYYSDKATADMKANCFNVQLELFRAFDLLSACRVLNKQANITDNVLHFTFDIIYYEIIVEENTAMQSQTTNTNL